MAKSQKVKSHKAIIKLYCFACKRVHSTSEHQHHGKGSFMKVRTKKSYAKAVKSKTKRSKQKTVRNKVEARLRKLAKHKRRVR